MTEHRASGEGDLNLSAARLAWTRELGQRARTVLADDERYFLRQALSTPCMDVVEQASGAVLVDSDGREVLDFHGNSAHHIGYGHPRVVAAVKAELDRLPFSPRRYTNAPAVALARKLAEITPGELSKSLFAPSGAAAVSMALKLARHATGRHRTLSMWGSFHGANLDTISVGGEAIFRAGAGPLLSGAEHVPPPGLASRFFGSDGLQYERLADYIDYVLEVQGDVAAGIAEPVRWTTVDVPPQGFWQLVRQSCDRHGALLVFDEVPGGLGRAGSWTICEQFGVVPDILVLGKALGGAVMPMAAMVAHPRLDVVADGALGHYTHEKSPVGAAAALATIDVIASEGLLERAQATGRSTLAALRELAAAHPLFAGARGIGMFWGLDVTPGRGATAAARAERLMYECLARGLSFKVGGGNVVTLCPPLNIPQEQLDRALGALQASADVVAGGHRHR